MENNQFQEIQFRCVYKTGGTFSSLYVERLRKAIFSAFSSPFSFVCLTDDPSLDCETTPLLHNWPGWWSKIELFRPDLPEVPAIYFDLDTILLKSVDCFRDIVLKNDFVALRGFNQRLARPGNMNFASGIMMGSFWKYSSVYSSFLQDPDKFMKQPRENWMHGDQGFIADHMDIKQIPRLQELCPSDFIVGKRLLSQTQRIPSQTGVVAWSGEPRLHTFEKKEKRFASIAVILAKLNKYWKGESL